MLYDHQREEIILRHERRSKEIAIELETQNREIAIFLDELNISFAQVAQYLNEPSHFSLQSWETIQQLQENLEEQSHLEIENIPRPKTEPLSTYFPKKPML